MKKIAAVDETGMEITSMDAYTESEVEFAKFNLSTLYPGRKIEVSEYITEKQRREALLNSKKVD